VNAGHEGAYVRRPGAIEQLAPTGPIIGLGDDAVFMSAATSIGTDDALVLSADGLTEARDPRGAFLTSAGVAAWLRESDASSSHQLIGALARRLRRYTRARNSDDLAILAVRLRGTRI
jgi:sigma-B regulation protein RsbU (phosphoserine phosphatase)